MTKTEITLRDCAFCKKVETECKCGRPRRDGK